MLNKDGGIEIDLTVVSVGKNHFRLISSAATRERDKFHIKKHLSKGVELIDVTDDYCVFGIFGPKSRLLMKDLSSADSVGSSNLYPIILSAFFSLAGFFNLKTLPFTF